MTVCGFLSHRGYPQIIIHFDSIFHYKPSRIGTLHFRRPPYLEIWKDLSTEWADGPPGTQIRSTSSTWWSWRRRRPAPCRGETAQPRPRCLKSSLCHFGAAAPVGAWSHAKQPAHCTLGVQTMKVRLYNIVGLENLLLEARKRFRQAGLQKLPCEGRMGIATDCSANGLI